MLLWIANQTTKVAKFFELCKRIFWFFSFVSSSCFDFCEYELAALVY